MSDTPKDRYIPGDLIRVKPSANWFTKDDAVMQVVKVGGDKFVKVNVNKASSCSYQVAVANIIPIPLTIEILKLNGWYQDAEGKWVYINDYNDVDIRLELDKEWCVYIYDAYSSLYIKYVHELQHLLFGFGILDDSFRV